ncbi:glycosyltransferase [Allokutzneria albata]|uniref:Sterol 3beta-glucosyltransferase n=1 Tax=Allokutzneria albata TaxID=211114 RepID=A0A1H0BVL9_ALLAB|nr:glycosyltransferase [Allokutzneria albata]SDN49704.1 sterol 3beta-glucosyltransferase [Allokutzneria albata]
MRVLMITAGSRGDVQPYAALAVALKNAGHEPVLAAATRSGEVFAGLGFPFVELDEGPMALTETVAQESKLALYRKAMGMLGRMFDDAWAVAADGADIVVHHPGALVGAHIAERLGVPAVVGALTPLYVPTRAFPLPLAPPWLPAAVNRASYRVVGLIGLPFRKTLMRWRADRLGLPPGKGRQDLVLHAISEHVVPPPPDWPATALSTGYWFLESTEEPELPEITGTTVYIGFGSMTGADPARTTATVLEAVRLAGVRAILARGWGGLTATDLPENVTMIDHVPHERLFPMVDAVVHHGGAGTVAAAAAAGRPQVLCPFLADQPYWGRRMHELGVAPPPLPERALDAGELAASIKEALSRSAEAARLGALVRAENGVGKAVRALERLCPTSGR